MTMKQKLLIPAIALAAAVAAPAAMATDTAGKFGLGMSKVIDEDTVALAGRYWASESAGLQGTVYYSSEDYQTAVNNIISDVEVTQWAVGLKGLFAPIVRENSKFLMSLEVGYNEAEVDVKRGGKSETDGWFVFPAIGAEFMLNGLPELGLNFEVGYRYEDSDDLNVQTDGVKGSVGVVYYF